MKKKKLLFIIWSYSYGGGAERILSNLMNALDPNKYEIDLLEYRHNTIHWEKTNDNIHVLPFIVDEVHDSRFRKYLMEKIVFHKPSLLRKKYIKKTYDYEISFNYMIPSFLLTQSGKSIAWTHTTIDEKKEGKRLIEKQRKFFKPVQNIVVISDSSKESYARLFPEYQDKMVLIRNGYDFDSILQKSKESIAEKHKRFTLVTVARMCEQKNPMRMLEIAKILKDRNNEFDFYVVGSGEEIPKMDAYIKDNQLEDYVHLVGFQANPFPYVKMSDVFLSLSKAEGFPTVFVEAMSLGKPVITTVVGGSKELINGGRNGFEISTNEEVVEAIEKLMNDPKLYEKLSKSASQFVLQYTIESQVKAFEQLLK